MIKRVLAVAALSFALPAFATIYEVENNGSIPTAQTLGLTGAGTVSIEGAITTNAIDGKADFDFFSLGRFAAGGSIKARVFGNLSFDPVAALYNSKGQMLTLNDDEDTFKYGSRSYIDYITLADDDYFLAVIGYQWRLITDAVPLNPLSETPGNKIGSQGGLHDQPGLRHRAADPRATAGQAAAEWHGAGAVRPRAVGAGAAGAARASPQPRRGLRSAGARAPGAGLTADSRRLV